MNLVNRIVYRRTFRNNSWLSSVERRNASTLTKDDREKRQKEMMSRGLPKRKPLPGVKHIILVASGKGGVGKSTAAVNIAVALKKLYPSKEVGLLDADVFGPSIPLMMNLHENPLVNENNLMIPLVNFGVKCMSMGFLVGDKGAVVWRGLMVMNAVEKLLRGSAWAPLDVLLVDTPPGTGDTHLSLAQLAPISGAVLVTTPRKAALQVTQRGASMFEKLDIPLVGLVNNMAWASCSSCNSKMNIFGGNEGVKQLASDIGTQIIGEIPIDGAAAELTEGGRPVVVSQPENIQALGFNAVAEKIVEFLDTH
ncbi:iron-sulfur protein NUBPL [Ischnura elegans]|uniref:iron-sulfur protein NUBPL n=1 Tax=Ischnura elegans TaxID=197161 RepID=UPI001ED869E6|nr:iron-sulfur protein NUBPL [Ischnura elegans]